MSGIRRVVKGIPVVGPALVRLRQSMRRRRISNSYLLADPTAVQDLDPAFLVSEVPPGSPDTRAIIICAGEATRWGNYLDTPKHLITIEGETLLSRTVRLLRERGVTDVYVVSKWDARYQISGSKQYIAKIDYATNVDADKFLSSKELWNTNGRTLVFYGDCYFTDEALDTIVSFSKREWTLFCRPHASEVTGTRFGECFTQSFYPEHLAEHQDNLHYIADLYKRGIINRCGGWEHYRAMTGRKDEAVRSPHIMTTNYVTIDDWTEDFDTPEDYDEWMKRRKMSYEMADA